MDIQLKKSGIGVKEKSQKSSVIFNKAEFICVCNVNTYFCLHDVHSLYSHASGNIYVFAGS